MQPTSLLTELFAAFGYGFIMLLATRPNFKNISYKPFDFTALLIGIKYLLSHF